MNFRPILFLFSLLISLNLSAQTPLTEETKKPQIKFRAAAELGYVAVLSHQIQFSQDGTNYDYVRQGGQDVLFPFSRLSLEMDINRHTIVLLYQPLRLESEVLLTDNLVVDGLTFPAGTAIQNLYNFPFYRISWMNELLPNNERAYFALGATIQIRNATISFQSLDGSLFRRKDSGLKSAAR